MVYLRIIFTILCAVGIALLIPAGMLFGWEGVGYCFFAALLFFALMLFCKQSQQLKDFHAQSENPNPSTAKSEHTDEK